MQTGRNEMWRYLVILINILRNKLGHLLWLNPGSCGYPRFGGAVTMVVMEVDGAEYYVEKIDFSSGK